MRNALVFSRINSVEIERCLTANGFNIVNSDPDFVICYGGDGTILLAERKFPQIPKLIIKKSRICRRYDYLFNDLEELIIKIRDQDYIMVEEIKLEVEYENTKLIGLNEVQVHSRLPIYAVRFSIKFDGELFEDLIGDGVVVATPFGSTGYYKSTGGRKFERGIGISFNNLHNKALESVVVSEDTMVTVELNRGPALIVADNDENILELKEQDAIAIRRSRSVANFISVT